MTGYYLEVYDGRRQWFPSFSDALNKARKLRYYTHSLILNQKGEPLYEVDGSRECYI